MGEIPLPRETTVQPALVEKLPWLDLVDSPTQGTVPTRFTAWRIISAAEDGIMPGNILFGRIDSLHSDGWRAHAASILGASGDPIMAVGSDADRKTSEDRLRHQSQQQSAIATHGLFALKKQFLQERFDRAVQLLAQTLQVGLTHLLELSGDGQVLLRAGVGWEPGQIGSTSVSASLQSLAGHTLAQNKPVVVDSLPLERRFPASQLLAQHGVRSGISVVVHGPHGAYGVLGVLTSEHRQFDADEVNFVQSIANVLADAIVRNHHEQQLRKSELSLSRAQKIAQIGSWEFDIHTGRVSASDELHRILGISLEDDQHTIQSYVDQYIHPDDREIIHAALRQSLLTGRTKPIEFRVFRPPENEVRYVCVQSEFHDQCTIVGTLQDITRRKLSEMELSRARDELRASEAKYRTIVDTTKEWIWETDEKGMLTYSNPSVESILGYTPAELTGRSSLELMQQDDRQRIAAKVPKMMSCGQGWSQWVHRWRHKDGSIRYLESNAVPIRDQAGKLIGYRGADRDITARIQAENELKSRERDLAHISRLSTMGELAAGIAHELNQPLSAISNFADACSEILESDPNFSDTQIQAWLRQIGQQAVRCGEMIRRMRRFAQKQTAQRGPVDVRVVIQDSIAILNGVTREHSVTLAVDLPPQPTAVLANETELQQVLVNVLRNACDTLIDAKIPEPRVVVRGQTCDQYLTVTIEDNGPGVPREAADRLFDPFFTTRRDGMGMGLAISRSIIENHHGRMWFDQAATQGARFHIQLPLHKSEQQDD